MASELGRARTTDGGPGAVLRAARSEVAASRSLSARQSVDVGRGQSVAADPPVAAFHLFDDAPGDLTHVLPLDRDHCISQLVDDLTLLFFTEHVLDDANLNGRHWIYPFVSCRGCWRVPRRDWAVCRFLLDTQATN